MRDIYSTEERSKIFAIVGMAIAASPAIGPIFGGAAAEYFGWKANFTALAIMGGILYAVCFLRLAESRPHNIHKRSLGSVMQLALTMMKDRHVISSALIIAICNAILFSFYAEAPFVFI